MNFLHSLFALSLVGSILRWGFLIWELIFYLLQTFCPHLGSFCVVSSSLRFGQRRRPEVKFGRNVVKKKQHKNYQDEDKKFAINKKLILDLFALFALFALKMVAWSLVARLPIFYRVSVTFSNLLETTAFSCPWFCKHNVSTASFFSHHQAFDLRKFKETPLVFTKLSLAPSEYQTHKQ